MTSTRTLTSLWSLTAALWLAASGALAADEPSRVKRIGVLMLGDPDSDAGVRVMRRLAALGVVDGKSAVFVPRYAQWQAERLPGLAAELVLAKVDVIVATTNLPAFAAKRATATVPIVVWAAHDTVGTGLAKSLARPGGNVTGTESLAPELDAKRVELIREIVPGLKTLAVLYNADDQGSPIHLRLALASAKSLGFRVAQLAVRGAADYDAVLASAAGQHLDGLLMFTDNVTFANWGRVAEFALRTHLPTVCEFAPLVEAGCLVSYGPSFAELDERVAQQVDRILKGAKPADLPFEQPTRYELVVNLKTARSIGVTLPQLLLLRADRVLE